MTETRKEQAETLKRINESSAGMLALVGFYYDDKLQLALREFMNNPTPDSKR
jgi:hypothetical protein